MKEPLPQRRLETKRQSKTAPANKSIPTHVQLRFPASDWGFSVPRHTSGSTVRKMSFFSVHGTHQRQSKQVKCCAKRSPSKLLLATSQDSTGNTRPPFLTDFTLHLSATHPTLDLPRLHIRRLRFQRTDAEERPDNRPACPGGENTELSMEEPTMR